MQDRKGTSWAEGFGNGSGNDSTSTEQPAAENPGTEADGWQQYRKWISKAPVPRQRRMGVDPSLYTWKGYRSWTEQVKRNWSDN